MIGVGKDRHNIESVFEVFEGNAESSKLPSPPTPPLPRPTIFIGHGRSPFWRYLKDNLQDQHGFDGIAYEVGARTGHAIRDILEEMLDKGDFAILVMTGEDSTADDRLMPRLNVVHELGSSKVTEDSVRQLSYLKRVLKSFHIFTVRTRFDSRKEKSKRLSEMSWLPCEGNSLNRAISSLHSRIVGPSVWTTKRERQSASRRIRSAMIRVPRVLQRVGDS